MRGPRQERNDKEDKCRRDRCSPQHDFSSSACPPIVLPISEPSVLLLRTTGPSYGKYGAPHSLLGCRKVAQRPVDLFDFEDGDTPMEVLTSFNGVYAAYYLGWAYTSCSFYISAGAEDCGRSA